MTDRLPLPRRSVLRGAAATGTAVLGTGRMLAAEEDDSPKLAGRVVDALGRPLNGMRVRAYGPIWLGPLDSDESEGFESSRGAEVGMASYDATRTDRKGRFTLRTPSEIGGNLKRGVEAYRERREMAKRYYWGEDADTLRDVVLVADYPDELGKALGSSDDPHKWFGTTSLPLPALTDGTRKIVANNKRIFDGRIPSTDGDTKVDGRVTIWKTVDGADPCTQTLWVEAEGAGTDITRGSDNIQGIGPGLLSLQAPEGVHVDYPQGDTLLPRYLHNYPGDSRDGVGRTPHIYLRNQLNTAGQNVPLHAPLAPHSSRLTQQYKRELLQKETELDFFTLGLSVAGLLSGGTLAILITLTSAAYSMYTNEGPDAPPKPDIPTLGDGAESLVGNPTAAPSPSLNDHDLHLADWPVIKETSELPLATAMRAPLRFGHGSLEPRTFAARGLWWIIDTTDKLRHPAVRLDHGFQVNPRDVSPLPDTWSAGRATGPYTRLRGEPGSSTDVKMFVTQPDRGPSGRTFDLPASNVMWASPLSNGERVEQVYDYRSAESHIPGDIEQNDTSLLFFWRDDKGLSFVCLHDSAEQDDTRGAVVFEFSGLPPEGEWVLRDDPGDSYTRTRATWGWTGENTDGAVFRGLSAGCSQITIVPEKWKGIDEWLLLSGTGDVSNPETHSLDMDKPVTFSLRAGGE